MMTESAAPRLVAQCSYPLVPLPYTVLLNANRVGSMGIKRTRLEVRSKFQIVCLPIFSSHSANTSYGKGIGGQH